MWWLILTVVVRQVMPGASYWFEWPLLFSLIGLGLLWTVPEQERASWRRVALLAAGAVPALLLCAWTIYAFYLAMGMDLIMIPALVAE